MSGPMSRSSLVRAGVFVVVSGLLIVGVGALFTNVRFGDSGRYRALFADSSGLEVGDPVRAAGVDVGRVKSIDLVRGDEVLIAFSVEPEARPTPATTARIRYADLVGGRYLDLADKPGSSAPPLAEGATIPESRTSPALDLDQLFNGFSPLLQGLDPAQINKLTSTLIGTFDSGGTNVATLLDTIARLTNGLADRDQVVGKLIDNLDTVLGAVDRHKDRFDTTIVNTQRVVSALAAQRGTLSSSLVHLDRLVHSGERFLATNRAPVRAATVQAGRVATAINSALGKVDHYLQILPASLRALGRAGAYGAFYNMYICGVTFTTSGPGGKEIRGPLIYDNDNSRCQFKTTPTTAVSTK